MNERKRLQRDSEIVEEALAMRVTPATLEAFARILARNEELLDALAACREDNGRLHEALALGAPMTSVDREETE